HLHQRCIHICACVEEHMTCIYCICIVVYMYRNAPYMLNMFARVSAYYLCMYVCMCVCVCVCYLLELRLSAPCSASSISVRTSCVCGCVCVPLNTALSLSCCSRLRS